MSDQIPLRHYDPLEVFPANKVYTLKDEELMVFALGHFFDDQEQLRSARQAYIDAVKQPGASLLEAFQQVAMVSALAQELDTRHATEGGLVFYLLNVWIEVFPSDHIKFSPLWADLHEAQLSRKTQEIKKLMATNHEEDNAGAPVMKGLQSTAAVGQGPEAKAHAESAVGTFGGIEAEGWEEANVDGIAEGVTEMRVSDWVVVDRQDAEAPQSG